MYKLLLYRVAFPRTFLNDLQGRCCLRSCLLGEKARAVQSRGVVPGGAMAPPDPRSVNPISVNGGRLCPSNNTDTPGSLDIPTALQSTVAGALEGAGGAVGGGLCGLHGSMWSGGACGRRCGRGWCGTHGSIWSTAALPKATVTAVVMS